MATRITFNFGDDGSQEVVVKHWDDLARALHAALRRDADIPPPKATEFWELASNIGQVSRIIGDLEAWRELAIVAADKTSDDTNRHAIGLAARMPASRVYRILDRHGRPRDRRDSPQRRLLEEAIQAGGGTWTPTRSIEALRAAGQDVTAKRARQLLRDIADAGLIAKVEPDRAVYRTA